MTGRTVGRRQAVIGTGAAVMTTAIGRAMERIWRHIAARLARVGTRWPRVRPHTLLVWKGGRMLLGTSSRCHIPIRAARRMAAPDRYRYVLSCPIVGAPGMKWTYNGGATALLGKLITRGTGEKLPDYARRVLFDPMGAGPTEWSHGNDGETRAASGLRLRPRDLLNVGRMVMANGVWQGRQIVPAKWQEQSTTRAVVIDGPFGYGWHWYLLSPQDGGPRTIGAAGWGGQRLFIMPALDLVVAMNCGNYWKSGMDQRRVADTIVKELVLPAVM